MIILPSLRRPLNLHRFVQAYHNTRATLPIWVIFDAADAGAYNGVATPEHWKRVTVPAGTPLGGIFNRIFEKYPDEQYYGMIADDVVPETPEWDVKLRDACLPDKISWGACGIQDEKLPVHPFIGGELLRRLGWWAAPPLKHWYVDNVWKMLADALQCGTYLPDVKMTHHHYVNGKAPMDRTYREQPNHRQDEDVYCKFRDEEFPKVLKRLGIE